MIVHFSEFASTADSSMTCFPLAPAPRAHDLKRTCSSSLSPPSNLNGALPNLKFALYYIQHNKLYLQDWWPRGILCVLVGDHPSWRNRPYRTQTRPYRFQVLQLELLRAFFNLIKNEFKNREKKTNFASTKFN